MAGFLITTTGTVPSVTFDDIGGRTFYHPVVDYDLSVEFTLQEIAGSADIQNAIDLGYITAKDVNGNPLTDVTVSETAGSWEFRKSYTDEDGKPYVEGEKSSYREVTVFSFPGTASGANPTIVEAVVSGKNSGTVGIRILDVGASPPAVISESSSFSVTKEDPQRFVLPSPTNLPATPSIFEIHIKKGSAKIRLHDIRIGRK